MSEPKEVQETTEDSNENEGYGREKAERRALDNFLNSLTKHPEYIAKFAELLGKVLEPWRVIGGSGAINTEYGKSTSQGRLVAVVKRDFPTWKVEIDGHVVPKIHQEMGLRSKGEEVCAFVDEILEKKGYILISKGHVIPPEGRAS